MLTLDKILFRRYFEHDEKLLYGVHKHWIDIFNTSVKMSVFGIIAPIGIWYFLPQYFLLPAIIWIILFFFWYLYHLIDWYFDVWLVTDVSIIDIEWRGLFHRLSSRISYTEVREVGWEMKGILPVLLRYGTMTIGMATGGKIELEHVSKPKKVEKKIIQIRDEKLAEHNINEKGNVQELLAKIISDHIAEHGVQLKKAKRNR